VDAPDYNSYADPFPSIPNKNVSAHEVGQTVNEVKKASRAFDKANQGIGSIVTNERGGKDINFPGRDTLSVPLKAWTALMDKVDNWAKRKIGTFANTDSRVDSIISAFVEKFGLDYDFRAAKTDYKLQIHKAKVRAMQLQMAVDRIDGIFNSTVKQFKTTDFLAGKKGRQLEQAKKALDRRKTQIAQGGITAFDDKYLMVREASKEFEKLEVELRKRGILSDHQFNRLNRKERAAAIAKIRQLDDIIKFEIPDNNDTPSQKQKALQKAVEKRKDIIVRLQIHYKNSGSNYLREIRDGIDQTERYMKRLTLDAMGKQFTNRRRNWVIKQDSEGVMHVRRVKSSKLKGTSELIGKGITQEAHDLHMHDLFTNIAKSEEDLGITGGVEVVGAAPWATKTPEKYTTEGKGMFGGESKGLKYVKIPKTEKQFGPLAGMYVEKHIYDDMETSFKDVKEVTKQWNKVFSTWKAGKTVWNPATTMRNAVSNMALAHVLGDVNFFRPAPWKDLITSWKESAGVDAGRIPTEKFAREILEETTIYSSSFSKAELGKDGQDYISKLIEHAEKFSPHEALSQIILGSSNPETLGFRREGLKNIGPYIYNALEVSMKSAVYKKARREGKSIEASEAKAQKALFDYGSVPPAIRFMRNWYSPFITFSYKALPALAKQFVRKPWKLIPYYGMTMAAEQMSQMMFDEEPEEAEAKKRLLPDYIDRSMLPYMPSHIRIATRGPNDNSDQYLDLSFWVPWGGATDLSDGALGWLPSALAPSNPVLTMSGSLLTNTDIFTGQPIYLDTDTFGQKAMKLFEKLYNEVAPAVLDMNKMDKVMGAVYGHENVMGDPKYTVGEAMVDWLVGIKFRNINYREQSMWRAQDLQKRANSLRTEYGKLFQKAAKGEHGVKSQQELQQELNDKLEDINDAFHERWARENE